MACWRDHSTGASRNRVTPMPRGNRPSMAARTRSGARKAREIVMLTCRTLHRSRLAMLSAFAFASARSSSSQRRPRAIDVTRSAREDLFAQLGLDGLEQVPINNGRLLALEDLTLKRHVSDIEAIAEQMGERSARERDAPDRLPCLETPHLGDDAPLTQVGHHQIEAAELEVAAEDGSDRLCFRLIDGYLAILRVIAERCHAADPETLALGGGDLVPDALGG